MLKVAGNPVFWNVKVKKMMYSSWAYYILIFQDIQFGSLVLLS